VAAFTFPAVAPATATLAALHHHAGLHSSTATVRRRPVGGPLSETPVPVQRGVSEDKPL